MKQAINFNWKFIPEYQDDYLKAFPKESQTINIPHSVKEVPYNYFDEKSYQMVSAYEKVFDIEEDIKDKIIHLVFDSYMLKAKIYLNDHDLGQHVSGWIKVNLDITEFVKQKGNRLVVILDSREDDQIPPFGYAVDYLTFGGIYREVSIEVHPQSYLENIFVKSNINGNVKISYDKVGEGTVKHKLFFKDELVLESDKDEFKINNPKLWDLDNPNLYKLVTSIDDREEYITKFGFRDDILIFWLV